MNYSKIQKKLAVILQPLSIVYKAIMAIRATAYSKQLKKTVKAKSFCIAVGNISWGGTGKTPIVSFLLDFAQKHALTTAVLTRGYGGKTSLRPLLVTSKSNPQESGDEALMLAQKHPQTIILADPMRSRALDYLEKKSAVDLCILDDAMQHLKLQRDLNLVILTQQDLLSWNKVIPAGSWREGEDALKRADVFLYRGAVNAETLKLINFKLAKFKKEVFPFSLQISSLKLASTTQPQRAKNESYNQDHLNIKDYLLCSAVGNPASVYQSAEDFMKRKPQNHYIFKDHYAYNAQDLQNMAVHNLPIICTEKDLVKIQPLLSNFKKLKLYSLQAEVKFLAGIFNKEDFSNRLKNYLKNKLSISSL